MGELFGTIIGFIIQVIGFVIGAIFKLIGAIFSFFGKAISDSNDRNAVKALQTLLTSLKARIKDCARMRDDARALMSTLPPNATERRELQRLIDYCNETHDDLQKDCDSLESDISTLTKESLKMASAKSKAAEKRLKGIKYPMEESRLEEIRNKYTSRNRFIESLLEYAGLRYSSAGENAWTYSSPTAMYRLAYDDSRGEVSITASPMPEVTFTDNPRRPWVYAEAQTAVYFNRDRKLEYCIRRRVTEINHYDLVEIFDCIRRTMGNPRFNRHALKARLTTMDVDDLECNVFPEIKGLTYTAPPPVDYIPDAEKMHGGKQRWAQLADVRQAGMLEPKGFIIGKLGYGSYLYTGPYNSHILTIASSGSGKGVGVVIPNLLRHAGSAVVLDPKGENLITTAHKRAEMGNTVYYYDPWEVIDHYNIKTGVSVVPQATKAQINPFDFLTPESADLVDQARMLASALILRTDPSAEFFYNGAESFLHKLIIYICTYYAPGDQRRNIVHLRGLITKPPKSLLMELTANKVDMLARGRTPHSLHTELIDWIDSQMSSKARSFNDIYSFALQATEFVSSERVANSLQTSNIDILKLKTTPMSLFLVLDMDKLLFVSDMYKPLVRLLITTCMMGASTREVTDNKLLFMLDEIAQLGNLQYLPNLMSIYRSRGVVVWTIWQNIEQIQTNYEKDWQSMIGNCDVQQYFGVNDEATAEIVSKGAGTTTIYREAYATTTGESRGETIARTYGTQAGWSSGSTQGTSSSTTYQGFNFSSTSGDSISHSDSESGGSSYSFSRSIQISTSYSEGTTRTKEAVPLITPYEVMAGGACGVEFVFYRAKCAYPILSGKIKYYRDLEFFGEASENVTR